MIDVWFEDEARIGQQGTVSRLWAPKGTRPRALRQVQYEYAYIFGSVCPARDEAIALIIQEVGTEAMIQHLKQISDCTAPGRIAVVVVDRAAWHTTKKINIFKNIVLVPLPPASPELNPTEQLWQQLRDNYFSNRTFSNYDDIELSCCEAWNDYTNRQGVISSLCSRTWANLNS
ncbi:MAG: IS630 family transposase [Myxococcales bacterium]|nr:IS630 family transposase [Myxococcales bacterium]